ncbi:MAG: hypothetical protein IJ783_07260, partial [Kiritimatiellae bacterium]|nr:hypothetical protein [Kiritimatiellia bacterium]
MLRPLREGLRSRPLRLGGEARHFDGRADGTGLVGRFLHGERFVAQKLALFHGCGALGRFGGAEWRRRVPSIVVELARVFGGKGVLPVAPARLVALAPHVAFVGRAVGSPLEIDLVLALQAFQHLLRRHVVVGVVGNPRHGLLQGVAPGVQPDLALYFAAAHGFARARHVGVSVRELPPQGNVVFEAEMGQKRRGAGHGALESVETLVFVSRDWILRRSALAAGLQHLLGSFRQGRRREGLPRLRRRYRFAGRHLCARLAHALGL